MDCTKRLAAALLAGFATVVVMVPVACAGWQLYYAHAAPDAEGTGPAALLGGMAVAALLGIAVACVVFVKAREP